jgi:phosphopantothenoylcysteine synthetase/decarboxylase
MNLLVTAGNTVTPIDRVRCLTNIFTGRTGARIARCGQARGHTVRLLTSHPDTIRNDAPIERWSLVPYRSFEDLQSLLESNLRQQGWDAIIHCAAVGDYRAAGIFAPAPFTRFRDDHHWESSVPELPALVDRNAGKVKSDEPELWLRLVRTPKLIDQIRAPWGFRGVLVKFKLEVGIDEDQLLEVAERSRRQSQADLIVANTLDGMASWAYLGPLAGGYERIERGQLAERLLEAVEHLHQERGHG